MDRLFVEKPAIAWVIAAFITIFGAIALLRLPVEQYPPVAPPTLSLRYVYNGADAETMDRSVAAAIDRELNGVRDLLYRSAVSRADGTGEIVLTFVSGADMNAARTDVQDRLNRAEPRLPEEVRRLGIRIRDNSTSFLEVVAIRSRTGATSPQQLGDFAATRIVNELSRIPGVGNVNLFSSEKAMRIWLDLEKLAGFALTPGDVLAAVREQNSQTAAGSLGDQPLAPGGAFNARIVAPNRFTDARQFRSIILRTNPDGSTIRLGDVATVEVGLESYATRSILDGREVAGMAVQLAPGANALSTKNAVTRRLQELESTFPPDIAWSVPYDATPFIEASISNVARTIAEAMLLVFLVMFLFLRSWRATLIPAIVVPIALLGGCIGLWMLDESLNQLSLFAMVVSIGILVDDAIVVVECVERLMAEERLTPAQATIQALGRIRGAVIGITLVLIAVFIPMAFFPGSTGGIYRQFSLTLVVSIFFSALLALTLTPALCATLLKPHEEAVRGKSDGAAQGAMRWLSSFLGWFDRRFERAIVVYIDRLGRMLSRPVRWMGFALVLFTVAALLYLRLPGGFLPDEDQGYFVVSYDAPAGTTMDRTIATVSGVEKAFLALPHADTIFSVAGFNFFGQGQSAAISWAMLKPYEDRPAKTDSIDSAIGAVFGAAAGIPGASIFAVNPPAIDTLGNATGFTMKVEDRSGADRSRLKASVNAILAAASRDPRLAYVRPEGQMSAPELALDIDRVKARALGLSVADVNATLSIAFGSAYANDFMSEGNIRRVYLAAKASQRMNSDDILAINVRGSHGRMIPFSAFTTVRWTAGPAQLERYNGYPTLTVAGQASSGHSSGEAIEAMEAIAGSALKPGQSFEWTGTAFEEKQAGGQIGLLLALSVVIVFLVLVVVYNSWLIPFSVLLVVPFGILGAALFTTLRGMPADIYFNVGLVTIIGLAAKNAILVVEFAAMEAEREGRRLQSILTAAEQRLRPILMTSLAFILGMAPLVFSAGAGAASRHAVGTGVMGGMIAATGFGIFFTPLFYHVVSGWFGKRGEPPAGSGQDAR